jgi:hypothetical protein
MTVLGRATVALGAAVLLVSCSSSSNHLATATTSTSVPTSTTASSLVSTTSLPALPTTTTTTGFAAFAGTWTIHGAQVIIVADGSGTADWRVYTWCSDNPTPPCDNLNNNQIIDGGHAAFHLTSVNGNTASGTVTQTTDPPTVAPGALVLQLVADDHLQFPNFSSPLCGPHSSPASCGA